MTLIASAGVWLALFLVPGLLLVRFLWGVYPRGQARGLVLPLLAGAIAAAPVIVLDGWLAQLSGYHGALHPIASPAALMVSIFLAGPLHEAAKLSAVMVGPRGDEKAPYRTLAAAMTCAVAFGCARSAWLIIGQAPTVDHTVRTLVAFAAQPLAVAIWAHALSRSSTLRPIARKLVLSLLSAGLLHGFVLHLSKSISFMSIIATAPLIIMLAALASWMRRDLLDREMESTRLSARSMPSFPRPSQRALDRALRQSRGHLLIHWIPIGVLTTTGVMLVLLMIAVVVGRWLGLDFSAVDRAEASAPAAGPLVLVTSAVLAAFPISGYLVAKASGTHGVLEPALSAALSIVAVLVMLGLAAPVALVFALAFAPIAFALACLGAWFAIGR